MYKLRKKTEVASHKLKEINLTHPEVWKNIHFCIGEGCKCGAKEYTFKQTFRDNDVVALIWELELYVRGGLSNIWKDFLRRDVMNIFKDDPLKIVEIVHLYKLSAHDTSHDKVSQEKKKNG